MCLWMWLALCERAGASLHSVCGTMACGCCDERLRCACELAVVYVCVFTGRSVDMCLLNGWCVWWHVPTNLRMNAMPQFELLACLLVCETGSGLLRMC